MDQLIGRHWHHLEALAVAELMGTNTERGLDLFEVQHRRERFGPNLITPARPTPAWLRFLKQFHQPLVYLLLAAGAVTAVMGEPVDASVIIGVVLVNAVIGYLQERKAVAAIEALSRSMVSPAALVRAGAPETVASPELVPGDLVIIQAGDRVPADVRLLEATDLSVDEAALTGESLPASKHPASLPVETGLADRHNMAYAGTLVATGQGRGIVVATGDHTEMGRISQLIAAAPTIQTPLTKKVAAFSGILLWAILAMAAVTFGVGVFRGEEPLTMFTAAVALAVGAIPEGLPAALTITLAIGVSRMARRRAVIRNLPAVETLGSTTVICTDKTGTLTENRMTVQAILAGGRRWRVSGTGLGSAGAIDAEDGGAPDEALRAILTAGCLCNDSRLVTIDGAPAVQGDPTEGALIVAALKGGMEHAAVLAAEPRIAAIPFDSARQFMATLHRRPGGGSIAYLKGALEAVTPLCGDATGAAEAAAGMAAQGLRVLAFASLELPGDARELGPALPAGPWRFLGLQGMIDPPRAAVPAAVATCQGAGITVKMITGDHPGTAGAIARAVGIARGGEDRALTGAAMAAMSDRELIEAAGDVNVFARVSPEQKLRLVEALQARGNVVAMTGDGVNDGPALKQADIGIAMGIAGTEVAKEAADMVLTDDDFTTIEAAVEEGRGVFENLTKFIVWTLPTNMGEALVIVAAVFLGIPLPILPVQILWINMTTAVCLGLMLAFEVREPGIMERPPRDPSRPILTRDLAVKIVLVGILLLAGAFGLYEWHLMENAGRPLDLVKAEARTIAVTVFVVVEAFYLFNCRSFRHGLLRIGLFSNPWVWGGTLVMAALQALFIYAPPMNRLFHTAPIDAMAWPPIVAVGLAAWVIVELQKVIARRFE